MLFPKGICSTNIMGTGWQTPIHRACNAIWRFCSRIHFVAGRQCTLP